MKKFIVLRYNKKCLAHLFSLRLYGVFFAGSRDKIRKLVRFSNHKQKKKKNLVKGVSSKENMLVLLNLQQMGFIFKNYTEKKA